jgi:hypothetical protein
VQDGMELERSEEFVALLKPQLDAAAGGGNTYLRQVANRCRDMLSWTHSPTAIRGIHCNVTVSTDLGFGTSIAVHVVT